MTRLTPVLEKLSTRMRNRKQAEIELDKFVSRMLTVVKSDLADEGCALDISHKSFADEGTEIHIMLTIKFPANIYDKSVGYVLIINKHGDNYRMSSGKGTATPLLVTPEQAADGFFAILNELA